MRWEREKILDLSGILGALLLITTALWFQAKHQWTWYHWVLAGAGSLGIASYLGLNWKVYYQFLGGKKGMERWNLLLYSLLVIAILGFANYLSYRHPKRWDVTKTRSNSLADESLKVLQQLAKPVKITGFFTAEASSRKEEAEKLLQRYAYASRNRIQYKLIDPNREPARAREYQVTSEGVLFLESGEKKISITQTTEEAITNALLELTTPQKEVCFTIGHGEKDPQDYQEHGYSDLARLISEKNFTVKTVEILREGKVPERCSVLVIAGPNKPFFEGELDMLRKYIEARGKLLIELDPWTQENLSGMLISYGITVKDAVIVEPISQVAGQNPLTILVTREGYSTAHEITRNIKVSSYFPLTAPLVVSDKPPSGWTVTSILKSSELSWGETDRKTADFTEGKDIKGPLTFGVALSKEETRMVILGDSDFVINANLRVVDTNGEIFLNVLRWLAHQEALISIPVKEEAGKPLLVSRSQMQEILFFAVLVLPAVFLISGGYVWLRRRGL